MMIKHRKFIIVLLCLALTPLFALQVYALDSDKLEKIQADLRQAMKEAEQISDAIDAGEPITSISKMMENTQTVDPSVLDTQTAAPETGSLVEYDDPSSVQFMFAKLQMELANTLKGSATQNLAEIKEGQEEQKRASSYLGQARELQVQADNSPIAIPSDFKAYLDEKGLSYPKTNSGLYDYEDWQIIISKLDGYLDKLAADTQSLMVSVQDFMGQYNSYLQNASTSVQNGMKQLSSVASGQSLFSPESNGVNVTPVAVSVLVGVLLGMLTMWLIMRRKAIKQQAEASI